MVLINPTPQSAIISNMKSAPKSKKTPAKQPKSRKKPPLILLALLVVVAVIGGVTAYANYRNDQQQEKQAFVADKARFAKVETDMAAAYVAMITAAGKPETETVIKTCSHIAAKFENGPLRCAVLYKFTLLYMDIGHVKDDLILRERSLMKTGKFVKTADSNNVDDIEETFSNKRALELSYLHNEHMGCKLTVSPKDYNLLVSNKVINWDYILSCRGGATAPVYPLAE